MKVLLAHNAYQHRGGEDSVVDDEVALLRGRGHEVELLTASNDDITGMGRLDLVGRTLWSRPAAARVRERCAAFKPDVMHVHNSFPLLSPAIHWAAQESGVPVVQTLHNFRLLCPQAMLLREGKVCEDCVGKLPLPGVVHACYRGSAVQTTVLTGMLALHRSIGTWRRRVNRFIALTHFSRSKFIEGGLPAERIVVKSNFADIPAPIGHSRDGFLFVGRLSPEKGLDVLAGGATRAQLTVKVVGSGPMQPELAAEPGLQLLGAMPIAQVLAQMHSAAALVMPSICYENFPRTLVEAWACGLPVIASRLGAMADLIEDGVTGLLFNAGDPQALATKLRWAVEHPEEMAAMGRRARVHYEMNYTAEHNLQQLMQIYGEAVSEGPRRD